MDKDDDMAKMQADSSVVGLLMIGADARYNIGGLNLKAQVNYGVVSNSGQYNAFTGSDLGSTISGWYGEVGYNVFHGSESLETELIPFARFEQYNTQASVDEGVVKNQALSRSDLTFGLGWKVAQGAMLKVDYQIFNNKGTDQAMHQFNAGVAVWF
jgi:hypothetical protein